MQFLTKELKTTAAGRYLANVGINIGEVELLLVLLKQAKKDLRATKHDKTLPPEMRIEAADEYNHAKSMIQQLIVVGAHLRMAEQKRREGRAKAEKGQKP